MPSSDFDSESRWRPIVVSLICAALGLALLYFSTWLGPSMADLSKLMSEAGSVVLISGGVGIMLDLFTRKSISQSVERTFSGMLTSIQGELAAVSQQTRRVADSNEVALTAKQTGFDGLITRNVELNSRVEDRLRTASQLTIVLNDGRTWVSWLQGPLKKRLADTDKRTRFVLLDPGSSVVEAQARKEGRKAQQVIDKIDTTVASLRDWSEASNASDRLEIWFQDLFNPHTVWLDEEGVVVALYNYTPGFADTIAFSFSNAMEAEQSVYRLFADDVEALLRSSHVRKVFPPPPEATLVSGEGHKTLDSKESNVAS